MIKNTSTYMEAHKIANMFGGSWITVLQLNHIFVWTNLYYLSLNLKLGVPTTSVVTI